ncbi:MAG TPA: hypothetical protein VGP50_14345 [Stellaceae bacterium]|jgi:hypothetical protein|nr:hypothetical protein [Stellaceae bacterium]
MTAPPFRQLGEIFAPLDHILASGGDARLHIDPITGLNGYGCRPYPRPDASTFASSTATSISERAYACAEAEHHDLIRAGLRQGFETAVDDRFEQLRDELRTVLDLADSGIEIVFSPSGTDSTLQALLVARAMLGTPLTSVIAAADETGSGVGDAASGRHFSALTSQAVIVKRGDPIQGLAEGVRRIAIPLRDERGHARPPGVMDEQVKRAVAAAAAAGERILLHAMDHSKLAAQCPSLDCLRAVADAAPGAVQIVIDACQMRISRTRLKRHLAEGHMVLITGSKFFTGPPFSGALLVPGALSQRMAALDVVPAGLADYSSRSDWPRAWQGLRAALPARVALGQLLRWIAALGEMRAYFAVPPSFRSFALARFATVVPALIAATPTRELLVDRSCGDGHATDDEEMASPTIFPFRLRRAGRLLSLEEARLVYRALNADVTAMLPAAATAADRQLAAQLCHVGQPVGLADPPRGTSGALRISAGARFVSESWSPAGESVAMANLDGEFAQIRAILAKIDLLLRHFEALGRWDARRTERKVARAG